MKGVFLKLVKNKVFLYMLSRYTTYALQFATTLLIAIKLGPTDFGVWSFVLLVIGLFNIIDFGISNSINVILVHDKENDELCATHMKSVIIINSVISLLVVILFLIVSFCDIPLLEKYQANVYYIYILAIVVFFYFNKSFASIYRVKNRLLEVALYQSTVPLLLFVSVLLISGETLIHYLVGSYLVGYLFVFLVFLVGGQIVFRGQTIFSDIRYVTSKGFWLFMYNSAFYLILYLTSVFVSAYYTVEEFGKFNFSVTLSNAIVLLIDSFSFIIFPKMIDRLSGDNYPAIKNVIDTIRVNYTTLVSLLIYAAFPVFYYFCLLMPKYEDTGLPLCFAALSLIPYILAFGINTFLIAQNQEKKLSGISVFSLCFNLLLIIVLIKYLHVCYAIAFLSILVSYSIYTLLCTYHMFGKVGNKMSFIQIVLYAFPLRQLIPFVLAIPTIYMSFSHQTPLLLFIPLVVFCLFNISRFQVVKESIKTIFNSPNIVDL